MEFLKNQLTRIQQQLSGLSASQRMLAAALVVIMVMTLFWWTRYAGQAEMEPVLDQAMAADEITRITNQLQAKGITYKVSGDRILVPVDRRSEVLAELAYAQLLPRDTKNAFDELIKQSSPWASPDEKRAMWNKYREATLAQILRNFPNVANAMVLIDQTEVRNFSGGVKPSATISLTMRSGGKPDSKLVNAAADLVSGAVANLSKGRIKVVVDGISCAVANPDENGGGMAGNWLEFVKEAERHYAHKLTEHLAFIEGAMVSVTVMPNNVQMDEKTHTYDPKNTVVKPIKEKTVTDDSNTTSKSAGDDGTGANVSARISTGGGGGGEESRNTRETTDTENVVKVGETVIEKKHPGGDAAITSASVFIPRSYFSRICKQRDPSKEPDDAQVNEMIKAELPGIRQGVVKCLGLADDKAVNVAPYTDLMPVVSAGTTPAAASSMSFGLGSHVKEIAVGALALISLFMISMMVKKSSPAPAVVIAPSAPKPPSTLDAGEQAVGEATEGAGALDGMELDDDTIRAQQMIDQVSSMVKDNPDAAATMVKRWMNRT